MLSSASVSMTSFSPHPRQSVLTTQAPCTFTTAAAATGHFPICAAGGAGVRPPWGGETSYSVVAVEGHTDELADCRSSQPASAPAAPPTPASLVSHMTEEFFREPLPTVLKR